MVTLYIVIPCYNEQEVLPETKTQLEHKYNQLVSQNKIADSSRIVFVDDGSKDRTWEMIEEIHNENGIFSGVKLSRNRGHQNALLAGLSTVAGLADCYISMDADLQDDINAIDGFLEEFGKGNEVVYGVRSTRKKDTFFKRFTAEFFYKLMNNLGAEVVFNHADYRLLSERALQGLLQFKEVNLFLRGIVPMVGFKSSKVYYERNERFAGESKYPLKKMIGFATQGITSLSIKPIRLIISLGFLTFVLSILMLLYFLARYFSGYTISGWTSTIVSIWALGGLQLLAIGVIGEYIGKIYLETKERPRFIIEEFVNTNDKEQK